MKLELKHLAPYLPYGLKCQIMGEFIDDEPDGKPRIFNIVGIVDGEVITHKSGYISNVENELEDCFPILRPLSDLIKEIKNNRLFFVSYERVQMLQFIEGKRKIDNVDYYLVVELLKLHFDVFGLIEKNLAININTLTK